MHGFYDICFDFRDRLPKFNILIRVVDQKIDNFTLLSSTFGSDFTLKINFDIRSKQGDLVENYLQIYTEQPA